MKKLFTILSILCVSLSVFGQQLPERFHFSADGRRLTVGNKPSTGLYNEDEPIQRMDLYFTQANFMQLLAANYASKTRIQGRLVYKGVTYDSVGVRFRGNTSYSRANAEKKSFSIALDWIKSNQDIEGHQTLHLNNAFEDASFLREVIYNGFNRLHIPAAKANYVNLYINNVNWGLYPNVQNIDGELMGEWFLSKKGTRWRGEGTGAGGGGSGAGVSTLNFLGADTTLYKTRYSLKNTDKAQPWYDLMNATRALNQVATVGVDSLKKIFDYDRSLWFVAQEIIFNDDDSYVAKGGMDYYVFWDSATNRVTPIEYDGNSAMKSTTWSPFYNEASANFAIQNKLFAQPALRQRYLSHVRTIIEESLDPNYCVSKVRSYAQKIDTFVRNDTKKNYTYAQFATDTLALRTFLTSRRTSLLANAEVNRPYPSIVSVTHYGEGGAALAKPLPAQTTKITAVVNFASGVNKVVLYYATGLDGYFNWVLMNDAGTSGDATAGDGIYTGNIPGYNQATYVRYYIEAIGNDANATAAYMPKGAEHDVYVYQVKSQLSSFASVTVNEIMAINQTGATDPNGQNEDWIELFNKTNAAVDLSGFYLSDNVENRKKWAFPAGTSIPANGYLIVWADEDGTQPGIHCSFKLSGAGETVIFSDRDSAIIDQVSFGQQRADFGYARRPNGTGNFVIQTPTFAANNNTGTSSATDLLTDRDVLLFPNPTTGGVTLKLDLDKMVDVTVTNVLGQVLYQNKFERQIFIDTQDWTAGIYLVRVGNQVVKKLVVK